MKDGEIEESLVDEKVRNILRMMLRLKMIGPEKKHRKTGAYNTEEHRRAVLDVARESMILLKMKIRYYRFRQNPAVRLP